jgi:hypothetical protein
VRLLVQKRGARNNPLRHGLLTEEQIRLWADRHFQPTGTWPKYYSGPIADNRGPEKRSRPKFGISGA